MKKIIIAILASITIFAILVSLTATSVFAESTNTKTEAKAASKSVLTSISGNVIDEISGEALVGVEIKLEGTDVKAYTDFDGHFVIDNLKSGNFKLIASYTSYNKTEKTVKLDSKSNQVKIELQASK